MFKLTDKPIDSAEVLADLCDDRAGAAVAFEGWVRNHNQGLKVNSLEYQVYEELAISEGKKILTEASEKFNILKITCVHRYGHLMIGDLSVYIASVSAHRDDSFKAARYVIDEIKKRLPIWKKEHYHDHKPKWVFCRDHQHHVHFEPKDYYLKQDKLVSHKQLGDKRVVVVGAGGLGCPVITGLAGAGVGVIDIVDHDRIDISNVHRQFLYSPNLVGESKAEVARSKASDINPFIKVRSRKDYLSIENAESLFIQADLVIDCTDNLSSKYLIHDVCFKLRIPFISASIHKFNAILRTFDPVAESGCLRCDSDIDSHEFSGNCNDYGVLGASVSAIGFLQACEAINFWQVAKMNRCETQSYLI